MAGITLPRKLLVICLSALDRSRGSVEVSALRLLLRYFSVVVTWVADVQNRLRPVDNWSVAERLLEESHGLLTGFRLHLVCILHVYHLFLECFEELVYSWLVFSGLLRCCAIV